MMNKNKKFFNKIFVVCIALLCILISGVSVFAVPPVGGEAAYEITKFSFNAEVDKAHQYTVTEKITVDLTDDLKSIEFAIPNGNYKYSNFTVDGIDYIGVDKVVAINDKRRLTEGNHTYTLKYTVKEYVDRDASRDVFFFDILPPSWLQPITDLNIKVKFPNDFPWDDIQYYAGQYGVQNVDTKLNFNADSTYKTVTISGERIPENFGITLKASLPNDYWQGALDGRWANNLMMIILFLVVAALGVMWYIGGRDPIPEKTKQIHPVDGVSVAEVGYVINGRVRIRDVIALIVYFGTKGYLKISEYEPKRYRLIRLKDPSAADEHKYIRNAYDLLFEDIPNNRALEMSELGPRLRRMKNAMRLAIEAGFSSNEMSSYTPLSRIFRIIGTALLSLSMGACVAFRDLSIFAPVNIVEILSVAAIGAGVIISISNVFDQQYYSEENAYTLRLIALGVCYVGLVVFIAGRTIVLTGNIVSAIISALLMIVSEFIVIIMRARAEGNAVLTNKFMQLRHFIYHPEAKVLLEAYIEDQDYYYEILPYALIFSGLETWSISFLTLNVPEPEWYSDDIEGHAFSNLLKADTTVLDYAKDIKTFSRTLEDAYHSMERQGRSIWQIKK